MRAVILAATILALSFVLSLMLVACGASDGPVNEVDPASNGAGPQEAPFGGHSQDYTHTAQDGTQYRCIAWKDFDAGGLWCEPLTSTEVQR